MAALSHIAAPDIRTARRLVVKIGSALLVDANGLRQGWLSALAMDVAEAKVRGTQVVLVSSGSIALGRKVLLHLVDGTSSTITKDYRTIVHELEAYSEVLGDKPRILALNKVDAMDAKQISDRRRALEKASGGEVHVISGVSGRGLQEVLREIYATIQKGNAKPEEVKPWQP